MSNRGKKLLTHGLSGTPEYNAWKNARSRCHNPEDAAYAQYGGRGILMATEWLDNPRGFLEHIGPRLSSKHTLERKINAKGYVPGNVCWATRRDNLLNRRPHRAIENFSNEIIITECKRRGLL